MFSSMDFGGTYASLQSRFKARSQRGKCECCRRCGLHRCAGTTGATGAGIPQHPLTPPEGYQQATFASTLPTVADQTANLGSQDWCHFSRWERRRCWGSVRRTRVLLVTAKLVVKETYQGRNSRWVCSSRHIVYLGLCARADRARTLLLC